MVANYVHTHGEVREIYKKYRVDSCESATVLHHAKRSRSLHRGQRAREETIVAVEMQ